MDLVARVISTVIGVISIVTLPKGLVTKSHDPFSRELGLARLEPSGKGGFGSGVRGSDIWVED